MLNSYQIDSMISYTILFAAGLSVAAALPASGQRIVGGSETTITQYPFSAALLNTWDFIHYQKKCGSTILNERIVLTAAHCVIGIAPIRWRIRVGSVYANSGGAILYAATVNIHPRYNITNHDRDVALIRSATEIFFSRDVRPTAFAHENYRLPDNTVLWAIGWGAIRYRGPHSETLRHVQVRSINQQICRNRYAELQMEVTPNMLCSGWLDEGGRDQCVGDEGSPVLNRNVVVGVRSWGMRCGLARYPGVSARVSELLNFNNAQELTFKLN